MTAQTDLPLPFGVDTPPLPESATRRAVEWMVALQAPDADAATRAAWQHWRDEHPDHASAWRHIEAVGDRLRSMPSGVLLHETGPSPRPNRRKALKALCFGATVGTSAWLMREGVRPGWLGWGADYRTAVGERRTIVLPDGTIAVLDTATAINVHFTTSVRGLRLLHGRILITTADSSGLRAAQEARPFVVDTDRGRLHALGTRFSVRQNSAHVETAVFEGAVAVGPALVGGAPIVIQAREQVRIDERGIGSVEQVPAAKDAWINGMLVAHDLPLADVVAELRRYRAGLLQYDGSIAGLKVSGVYPLTDTDQVLDMLSRNLPIAVSWRTRYWVTLQSSSK